MEKGKLQLTDDIEQVYEKTITKFGTGAKIDAPKDSIGKKVYVLIRKWVAILNFRAKPEHRSKAYKYKLNDENAWQGYW